MVDHLLTKNLLWYNLDCWLRMILFVFLHPDPSTKLVMIEQLGKRKMERISSLLLFLCQCYVMVLDVVVLILMMISMAEEVCGRR